MCDSSVTSPGGRRPEPGVYYPRSTAEFLSWFGSDEDYLDYLDPWTTWTVVGRPPSYEGISM
jgi:hypothetical protein